MAVFRSELSFSVGGDSSGRDAPGTPGLEARIGLEITRADELVRVRDVLRRWLSESGATDEDAWTIALATSEACANAIAHGHGARDARIAVTASRGREQAVIEIRDRGRWREPRETGHGRGIALMREIMDDVRIDANETGTKVRLTRRLGSDSQA